MKTVLVISDSAENTDYDLEKSIRTIKDHGLDPLAVMSTIFNTDGTSESFDVSEMIDYVFDECDASAVSVCYMTSAPAITFLTNKIRRLGDHAPIVSTPSMISDTGAILIDEDTYHALCDEFLYYVTVIVINPFEAELLAGFECPLGADLQKAARQINSEYGCSVFIKASDRTDGKSLLFSGESTTWIAKKTSPSDFEFGRYNLGTAVACSLAQEKQVSQAVRTAVDFVYGIKPDQPMKPITRTAVPSFSVLRKEVPAAEEPKHAATSSSLVSPAKSIREIAQRLQAEMPPEEEKGITSTISEAVPESNVSVVDIVPPEVKEREKSTVSHLQSLRDRLNRLSGEG